MMRVIYIAGPYRAPTFSQRDENIRAAAKLAAKVWAAGHIALCPHMNSAHMDEHAPEQHWLDGTLELMRRSDAVLLIDLDAAKKSAGTRGEVREARRLNKPVFSSFDHLLEWCALERCETQTDASAGA